MFHGAVSGQAAVIKRYQLSSPEDTLQAAAEVRSDSTHLCVLAGCASTQLKFRAAPLHAGHCAPKQCPKH